MNSELVQRAELGMMSGNILYVNFLFKKLHVNNGFQTIRALQKWSELAWQLVSLRLVGTLEQRISPEGQKHRHVSGWKGSKAPRSDCQVSWATQHPRGEALAALSLPLGGADGESKN